MIAFFFLFNQGGVMAAMPFCHALLRRPMLFSVGSGFAASFAYDIITSVYSVALSPI